MGNHRYDILRSTRTNLWYNFQAWFSSIRAEAKASFASRLLIMILKADARRLVMSEYLVTSLMLMMSVSDCLLLESGGESTALAVGLESPCSSSMQMRVQQVSSVCM